MSGRKNSFQKSFASGGLVVLVTFLIAVTIVTVITLNFGETGQTVNAVIFLAVAWMVYHARMSTGQHKRDAIARAVLEAKPGERTEQFALYLRSFTFRQTTSSQAHSISIFTPVVDLETMISEIIGRRFPVVALGVPGSRYGPGLIASEDQEWKNKFTRLATQASRIIVIPRDTQGTQYEVDWIFTTRNWEKTIFVIPLRKDNHWDRAISCLANAGFRTDTILRTLGEKQDFALIKYNDPEFFVPVYCDFEFGSLQIALGNVAACIQAVPEEKQTVNPDDFDWSSIGPSRELDPNFDFSTLNKGNESKRNDS